MRGCVTQSVDVAEPDVPPEFEAILADYLRHLRAQRNLAAHTVRAYRTDLLNLFCHLDRLGIDSLAKVDLRALRSWLAKQHTIGHARTTLQRRAAAGPGVLRVGSRVGRHCRRSSGKPAITEVHPCPAANAGTGHGGSDARRGYRYRPGIRGPVAARDVALLELLYSTGIRVSELCGLDLNDLIESGR
jgi:integrase/recombinase XerC